MSNLRSSASPHAPPNWRGNTYSLPRSRRLYHYSTAVLLGLVAVILVGATVLMWLSTFAALPLASGPFLPELHPVARLGLSLALLLIGGLLLRYTFEVGLTTARTTLHIAPEGFIYTANGGYLWSPWDNAVRIERLFIGNRWHEGITLRAPANVAGRTAGFTVFSTDVLPWNQFVPLTPFGDLWRTAPVAGLKDNQQVAQLARWLLPAQRLPGATQSEGALYHDIRRRAPHLFAGE